MAKLKILLLFSGFFALWLFSPLEGRLLISGGTLGYAAWLFARSLSKRYTPIISRYAYLVDGDLSPAEKSYTRKVTWVWAVLLAVFSLCLLLGIIFSGMRLPIWMVPGCLLGLLLGEYWLRPFFIEVRQNRNLWSF